GIRAAAPAAAVCHERRSRRSFPLPLMGRGRGGVMFAQRSVDNGPDTVGIAEHLMIPKPDYQISFTFDYGGPRCFPIGLMPAAFLSILTLAALSTRPFTSTSAIAG